MQISMKKLNQFQRERSSDTFGHISIFFNCMQGAQMTLILSTQEFFFSAEQVSFFSLYFDILVVLLSGS